MYNLTKKSRGYFPDNKQGQKEYEKQWGKDEQFAPIIELIEKGLEK